MSEALLQNAWRLHEAGKMLEAARAYADVLRLDPRNFDALHQLGIIYLQNGHFADAERLFASAVQVNPQPAELFYNRGCALQGLGRYPDALAAFARALSIRPEFVEARNNRGVTLLAMKRFSEALACFDKVAADRAGLAMVHHNRATALLALQQFERALEASDVALKLDSNSPEAHYSRGAALAMLGKREEAISCFERALELRPDYVDALVYRGIAYAMLSRHEEAILDFNAALRRKPGDIDILYNRSTSLMVLRRFEEALLDCEAVLKGDPHFKYARGNLLHAHVQCGDWRNLNEEKARIAEGVRAGLRALRPLQHLAISGSPEELRHSARIWVAYDCPPSPDPLWRGERYKHDRIRIAYVSADFRFHPVGILAAALFEHHDRSRFETIGISIGINDGGGMRERMQGAFEHFFDMRNRGDAEIAQLLHEKETDIAVDLMGFTEDSYTGVFARRPAGLQVNYLGFPGTMGAPYMDYIVADRFVIPKDQQGFYDEKVVYLPDTYLPNDSTRKISERVPSRAEAGLPDEGFVFCSFNNLYKLNPEMFDIWMRLLRSVEGSVLWLSRATAVTAGNLRREAELRGIAGERILFAPFVASPEDHLARLSLADLSLDTLPYNAHATSCDSLWAGVPVVTLMGTSFPGRVGASVLSAIGLPELIAKTPAEYETIALRLARNPRALTALKNKLARNRKTHALFDTAGFTRNLEAAYVTMWQRHQKGKPPQSFAVVPALVVP
jgi:predicted O-linked N-acetylglucosamine transferase (SPINDLY family)